MQFGPYLALKFVNGPFLVIFKPVKKVVQNSTAEKKLIYCMEYAFFKKMQFVIEQ